MSDAINPDHYKRLPAEAIEIIESAIQNAPDNIAAYNHGQQLKYDLRLFEKGKTLREYLIDQEKHCWYSDRLREHLRKLVEQEDKCEQQKEADQQSLKDHPFGKLKDPAIKQSLTTQPPDGWRWLEVGEVIRKGDEGFENGRFYAIEPTKIGMTLQAHWMTTIRRNRFDVGEKVVHGFGDRQSILVVENILGDGWVDLVRDGVATAYHVKDLAPYIEDAK